MVAKSDVGPDRAPRNRIGAEMAWPLMSLDVEGTVVSERVAGEYGLRFTGPRELISAFPLDRATQPGRKMASEV